MINGKIFVGKMSLHSFYEKKKWNIKDGLSHFPIRAEIVVGLLKGIRKLDFY